MGGGGGGGGGQEDKLVAACKVRPSTTTQRGRRMERTGVGCRVDLASCWLLKSRPPGVRRTRCHHPVSDWAGGGGAYQAESGGVPSAVGGAGRSGTTDYGARGSARSSRSRRPGGRTQALARWVTGAAGMHTQALARWVWRPCSWMRLPATASRSHPVRSARSSCLAPRTCGPKGARARHTSRHESARA